MSTRMCRFLPLIFLPASYPCGSMHAPLVWGFGCQGVSASTAHLSSFVSLFDLKARFSFSLIAATNASAYFLLFDCAAGFLPRRRAQELSTTTKGLALSVPSTAAPSNAGLVSKMTIRGEPRVRARTYRATTLYSVGLRTRTMMQ